jgi:DUF971 family protein
MPSPSPLVITTSAPESLTIEWSDDSVTSLTAADLRRICPCAHCVSEHTGELLLDPESVAEDVTQSGAVLVGNYALRVNFSDGHATGIFTWGLLHKVATPRAGNER